MCTQTLSPFTVKCKKTVFFDLKNQNFQQYIVQIVTNYQIFTCKHKLLFRTKYLNLNILFVNLLSHTKKRKFAFIIIHLHVNFILDIFFLQNQQNFKQTFVFTFYFNFTNHSLYNAFLCQVSMQKKITIIYMYLVTQIYTRYTIMCV